MVLTPVHTSDADNPAERLVFEQYGTSNATVTPFTIVIGPAPGRSGETFVVTPETYRAIQSRVSRGATVPPVDLAPMRFSHVMEFRRDRLFRAFYIDLEQINVILQVLKPISRVIPDRRQ